jgi:hypothetical protein
MAGQIPGPASGSWHSGKDGADLVAILLTRNLVDVMDTIVQFAELCVRREPDTVRDPLDAAEPSIVARLSGGSSCRTMEL